jgi:hypothetical protein
MSAAAVQRAMAAAAKREAAEELSRALERLWHLHRQDFAVLTGPGTPFLPPVDVAAVKAAHLQRALAGVRWFRRAERKSARSNAAVTAAEEVAALEATREAELSRLQQDLDRDWAALRANAPEVVLAALASAFEDNEAPAAAVGVDEAEVSLVVLVPGLEAVPERTPDTTPAGNLTLRKMTKSQRCQLHSTLVAAHVLLTVKEALAVAPGLSACRIVAIQHSGQDAYGQPRVDVLLAARFDRARLRGVSWDTSTAQQILEDAATDRVVNLRRQTRQMLPVDLTGHPDIAGMLRHLDREGLVPGTAR